MPASLRGGRIGLMALGLVVVAHPAGAADIELLGTPRCAIRDGLVARIERALGRRLEDTPDVHGRIDVLRDSGAFTARLELSSPGSPVPSRQRSFRAPTCAKLADTLTLALVLTLGARHGAAWTCAAPRREVSEPGCP